MEDSVKQFEDYLYKEKNYSLLTVRAYLRDLEVFSCFVQERYQVGLLEVEYVFIRAWIVSLIDSGLSTVSVNRRVASLKAYYKFLLKSKQLKDSPLAKHQSLKMAKKVQVPFSEKELENALLLQPLKEGFEGLRDKLVVDLLYTTGMRRSELIDLQMSNVDLAAGVLKVLGKRKKERIIPILDEISSQIKLYLKERNALNVIIDENNLFLLSNGKKMNETFVYRLINCYLSNVSEKLKKSPHMLRHTFATHMLNRGADLNSIKEFLGHSSLASTQVYTQSSLAELKEVYSKAHPRNVK